MHVLTQVDDQIVSEVDDAGGAEDEVGEVIAGRVTGDSATGSLAELRARGLAKLTRELVLAVKRVDVENLGPHDQRFITHLQRLFAVNHRVDELGIKRQRILELRVAGLPPQLRKPADVL